jgi:cyclopropane fatty-acyl-phospholipid synthase-like methyltransferase
MTKQTWPAPERNKQPILDVLRRVLPARGTLLEVASGSGQHVAFFAREMPDWTFQPSDLDAENLASIRSYCQESGLPNLRAPIGLDVREPSWEVHQVEAIFSANMIHIAAWECTVGLLRGVETHLRKSGVFALYGPFKIAGSHTAPSNAAFDDSLRARNPEWGVRDLEAVTALAETRGLSFRERVEMPANNQMLIFDRV